MEDKLGTYITKLMTTILDKEQEDFVKELAMSELGRLKFNIEDPEVARAELLNNVIYIKQRDIFFHLSTNE